MARILSDTINSLVELGLDLENFHLIGHSMGAQMAGFIGRYTKYELPRITGIVNNIFKLVGCINNILARLINEIVFFH